MPYTPKEFPGWWPVPDNEPLKQGDVWVWCGIGANSYGASVYGPSILYPTSTHPVSQLGQSQSSVAGGSDLQDAETRMWQAYRPIPAIAQQNPFQNYAGTINPDWIEAHPLSSTTMKASSYKEWDAKIQKTIAGSAKMEELPRKKPSKFKKDEAPPPAKERVSVYGVSYPDSKDDDWEGYDGAGWVHKLELPSFIGDYQQCCASKTWHKFSFMSPTGNGLYVNKREIKSGAWEVCKSSHHAFPKSEMRDAVDESGGKIRVSLTWRDRRFFMDDYDKNFYHTNSRIVVKKSDKYKHISNYTYQKSKIFCGCDACNSVFEIVHDLVKFREDVNQKICDACYEAYLAKDVIKAHNHTQYPKAIFTAPYIPKITEEGKARWNAAMSSLNHPLQGESWKNVQMKKVFLYGVEVETEFINPDKPGKRPRMALAAWKALGHDFCIIKHDGSLHGRRDPEAGEKIRRGGDYGFEIVSAPCDLATHRERWKRLENMEGYAELRAWDVGTCGMHVHVSRAPMTALQICRIGYLMNHPKLKDFIQMVAGRAAARYNRFIPKKSVSEGNRPDMDKDKYTALNVKHAHTVEFRIFRGTVNPSHIIRNLEFVQAIVQFCHPGDRSLKDLSDELAIVRFINSHEKEWPELNRWLRQVAKDREMYLKVLRPTKGAWGPKDTRTIEGKKQIAVDEVHNPEEPIKPKKPEKQAKLAGIPSYDDPEDDV